MQFVSSSQTSRPYKSSFTVKEALLQSLASIASTCSYASYASKEMVAIKPHVVAISGKKLKFIYPISNYDV